MDLRRNQVRRPFPTPGLGTLWVSGESLRDRRVSCLPQWTVCPTRSPSQDTNPSTCRGECSWSGPLATPPGHCNLGALANGPRRNPPYCLRSGWADTDTGGPPQPLRSGTSPASLASSCHPAPPMFAAVLVPASPLSSPGFPLSRAPCRAPWFLPCPVRLCCLSLLWRVRLFGFLFCICALAAWRVQRSPPASPPGVLVCPLPPANVPSLSPRCLRPFPGWVEEKGVAGGVIAVCPVA